MAAFSARLILAMFGCLAMAPKAAASQPFLTAEDRALLQGLVKEFLFDPKDAERVIVKQVIYSVHGGWEQEVEAWRVAGGKGKPRRFFLADGEMARVEPSIVIREIDFHAACRSRYSAAFIKAEKADGKQRDFTFDRVRKTAAGALAEADLVNAAWLLRRGDEALAARALAHLRQGGGETRQSLRNDLAWRAYAGLVHAYMARADAEALSHGERLRRLYPAEIETLQFDQAERIVQEIRRRQQKGTAGVAPPKMLPEGFARWEPGRQARFLIDRLEEVDARQPGAPSEVDLASDRQVKALVTLGEAAVPSLLDALEHDNRLTRSVEYWRENARAREVIEVRDAAMTALLLILKIQYFEPAGQAVYGHDEAARNRRAVLLRAYWEKYGRLPFDERMMAILSDPQADLEARREAAENLASLVEEHPRHLQIGTSGGATKPPERPNPAVWKFSQPTVAEAMLAALDDHLREYDRKAAVEGGPFSTVQRRDLEKAWRFALIYLHDVRIAPEVARRAMGAADAQARAEWALVGHTLGDPEPMRRFAADFEAGQLRIDLEQVQLGELPTIFNVLTEAGTPEADRALQAAVAVAHPYHAALVQVILHGFNHSTDFQSWWDNPICLDFLRVALEDHAGVESVCDLAAQALGKIIYGLPEYHPDSENAKEELGAFIRAYDRFAHHYRPASREEYELLDARRPLYLPPLGLLTRAATAEDVAEGRAIFHLRGRGMPATLSLPARGVLRRQSDKNATAPLLIVQAEMGPDGKKTYGIITPHRIETVPASQLARIETGVEVARALEAQRRRESDEDESGDANVRLPEPGSR